MAAYGTSPRRKVAQIVFLLLSTRVAREHRGTLSLQYMHCFARRLSTHRICLGDSFEHGPRFPRASKPRRIPSSTVKNRNKPNQPFFKNTIELIVDSYLGDPRDKQSGSARGHCSAQPTYRGRHAQRRVPLSLSLTPI